MQALIIAAKDDFVTRNVEILEGKNLTEIIVVSDAKIKVPECGAPVILVECDELTNIWYGILAAKEYLVNKTTLVVPGNEMLSEEGLNGVLSDEEGSMVLMQGLKFYKNTGAYLMEGTFFNNIPEKDVAESIFATGEDKLNKYHKRFGGYWRYAGLYDFCYLVNPYFPNKRFMNEMKDVFETLITEYPSGMGVNSTLAADFFGLNNTQVCVGNGTSELIKSLMENFTGRIGLVYPTFEEYPHRKLQEELVPFMGINDDFSYTVDDMMGFYKDKQVDAIVLVNPDNPSGHFILKADILRFAAWCRERNIALIVDESFVDFADIQGQTVLDKEILMEYPNLIVLKSISKSYGVPGLRLGIIASDNTKLISQMKKDVSIWNINSFGEFFWQIIGKYRTDYDKAMNNFIQVRNRYMDKLKEVRNLKVFPTQANYVMCRLEGEMSSGELAQIMLNKYNILIKDLSGKEGLRGGDYIRLSVKTDEENNYVVRVLNELL